MAEQKPTSSPAEAPEAKSLKDLREKDTDVLAYLKNIPNIKDTEKTELEKEYKDALAQLEKDHDKEKDTTIEGIKDELAKLKTNLQKEKDDENDTVDDDDKDKQTDVDKQKLLTNEIRGRLDEFRKSIENKLKPAVKPAEQPKKEEKPETPEEKAQADGIAKAKTFFALDDGDEIKVAPKGTSSWGEYFKNLIRGWMISFKEMFHMDVTEDKAKLEGYTNYEMQQKSTILFSALSPYIGKGIDSLRDPKEGKKSGEESLVKLVEGAGVPIKYSRSSLKYIFTGDQTTLSKIPDSVKKQDLQAIRGKYLYLERVKGTLSEKTPREKLEEIFTIEPEKKGAYIEEAENTDFALYNLPAPAQDDEVLPQHDDNNNPEKPKEWAQKKEAALKADEELSTAKKELDTARALPAADPKKAETLKSAEEKVRVAQEKVDALIKTEQEEAEKLFKQSKEEEQKQNLALEDGKKEEKSAKELMDKHPDDKELKKKYEDIVNANLQITKKIDIYKVMNGKMEIEKKRIVPTTTAKEAVAASEEMDRLYTVGRKELGYKTPDERKKDGGKDGGETIENGDIDELIKKYDGTKYENKKENTENLLPVITNKLNFLKIRKNGNDLILQEGVFVENVNINKDNTLTYRGVTLKPEDALRLAQFDLYCKELIGNIKTEQMYQGYELQIGLNSQRLKMANDSDWQKDELKNNALQIIGRGGTCYAKLMEKIPDFLPNWNWQDMYNFVAGKDISPSEKDKMSGKETKKITQVDLDAILKRTMEQSKDAKDIYGSIDAKTGQISIQRESSDGKISTESIFPLDGGKFMIGNIIFPNITDAVKMANMRNWVNWHEQRDEPLYMDGDNEIQIDGTLWWNTTLIDDGKIPEFISHGVAEDGSKLDTVKKVFEFLQGATKVGKDGKYGTENAKKYWKPANNN